VKSHILAFCIILLGLVIYPITSFADSITVRIDKSNVERGEDIVIYGTAEAINEITIKIVRPDKTIFYLDILSVENRKYSTKISIPLSEDLSPFGEYKIVVGTETFNVNTSFKVVSDGDGDPSDNNGDDKDKDGSNEDKGGKNKKETGDESNNKGDSGNRKNNGNGGGIVTNDGPDNKGGSKLPSTSTMLYNYLTIAVVILTFGVFLWFYQKRREQSKKQSRKYHGK